MENYIENFDKILKSDELQEITKFLNGREISEKDYEKTYTDIQNKLSKIEATLKELIAGVNKDKAKFTDSEWETIQSMISKFKEIKKSFNNTILKPSEFKEKVAQAEVIDLGDISIQSTYFDISLSASELNQLKPEKLLAKTKNGVLYYLVTLNGEKTILRYNEGSDSDEIALYTNAPINNTTSSDEIKRIINNAERQGFRDVEMDGTKDAGLIGGAAIAGGYAGGTIGVGAGAAAGLGVFSLPGGVIGGGIGAISGAVLAGITVAQDKDYTTLDYRNDFSKDMANLSSKNKVSNYRK